MRFLEFGLLSIQLLQRSTELLEFSIESQALPNLFSNRLYVCLSPSQCRLSFSQLGGQPCDLRLHTLLPDFEVLDFGVDLITVIVETAPDGCIDHAVMSTIGFMVASRAISRSLPTCFTLVLMSPL